MLKFTKKLVNSISALVAVFMGLCLLVGLAYQGYQFWQTRHIRGIYTLSGSFSHELKKKVFDPTTPIELEVGNNCLSFKIHLSDKCVQKTEQCGLEVENNVFIKVTRYKTKFEGECNQQNEKANFNKRYIYSKQGNKLELTDIETKMTDSYLEI